MRLAASAALAVPLTMCCTQTAEPPGYMLASAERRSVICTDAETAERIRAILYTALDQALQAQIVHVFQVWMKDDHDQPARAAAGARDGVNAYIHARQGLAAWTPMICPTP